MEKDALKPIIEAILFAADHPVTFDKIVGTLEGEDREIVKTALKELVEDYAQDSRGIGLEEIAGGFQFRTKVAHAPWIKRLFNIGMQKISKASLESLAIVAYRQPITRAELEAIRGVDSSGVLKTLLERRLVKIVGRQEVPGRPVMYGTTKEFLETFNLKDLSGLPTLKDIETLEKEFEEGAYGEEGLNAPAAATEATEDVEGIEVGDDAGEKADRAGGGGEARTEAAEAGEVPTDEGPNDEAPEEEGGGKP